MRGRGVYAPTHAQFIYGGWVAVPAERNSFWRLCPAGPPGVSERGLTQAGDLALTSEKSVVEEPVPAFI